MGLPDEPEAVGGSLQVGWPTGAAVASTSQTVLACDPPSQLLSSLEMGSELELVTAACSDGHHPAQVETVMGQTLPIRPLQGVLLFTRVLHTEKFRFS